MSYEQQRSQATRPDLWPEFRPAPVWTVAELCCAGGWDCDCDEDDR